MGMLTCETGVGSSRYAADYKEKEKLHHRY